MSVLSKEQRTKGGVTLNVSFQEFMQMVKVAFDTPHDQTACPVTRTLNVIQGKWKEHILFYLSSKESSRFGEIHSANPQISKTMLSSVLKQLEADGLVIRKQYNEIPPRTEYSLTEPGKDLMPIFYEIYKWGSKHL